MMTRGCLRSYIFRNCFRTGNNGNNVTRDWEERRIWGETFTNSSDPGCLCDECSWRH